MPLVAGEPASAVRTSAGPGRTATDCHRRREALDAARESYKHLSEPGKRILLAELELLTGYQRKSLMRLLNQRPSVEPAAGADGADDPSKRGQHHRRRDGPEAVAALVPLWEAINRLFGKRLKALLPLLVESHGHHGHQSLEPGLREQDPAINRATINRLLAPIRMASGSNN